MSYRLSCIYHLPPHENADEYFWIFIELVAREACRYRVMMAIIVRVLRFAERKRESCGQSRWPSTHDTVPPVPGLPSIDERR